MGGLKEINAINWLFIAYLEPTSLARTRNCHLQEMKAIRTNGSSFGINSPNFDGFRSFQIAIPKLQRVQS